MAAERWASASVAGSTRRVIVYESGGGGKKLRQEDRKA